MTNPPTPSWHTYRLFGLTLAANIPFKNQLQPAEGAKPDLTFTCEDSPPLPAADWAGRRPVYPHPLAQQPTAAPFQLFTLAGYDLIRYPGAFDFYLWPGRIFCHVHDPAYLPSLEICFLGTVLSFWLERQGIAVLHASAVVARPYALAFLSGNGGGKSSLAAAFMQVGHLLLTDDLLALKKAGETFIAQPGYPQFRFWPQQARHFWGADAALEPIHPAINKRRVPLASTDSGQFHDTPHPLSRIYLLDRQPPTAGSTKIEITPLSPRDALIELLRYSFVGRLAEAAGLQSARLSFLARLVQKVPLRRLSYPTDLAALPAVSAAILADATSPPS